MAQDPITYIMLVFIVITGACTGFKSNDNLPGEIPNIEINIKAEHRVKLRRKREEALRIGLLNSKDEDFVPVTIRFDTTVYSGMARLKGDWLDHLKSNKWSLRIKLDSSQSILGLRSFSIQHPKTRYFLSEYVLHQLLLDEHILTPRYEFIHVQMNGSNQGIYALEEHFDRLLLETQDRREGPIIRFNEEGFWQAHKYSIENKLDLNYSIPIFEASEIEPFQKNRILNNRQLFRQFNSGKKRLEDFRNNKNIETSIDLDVWAKFFAICDLTQSYHALIWHNLRFYYNPFTTKLEPVVFDGYTESGPYQWFSKPYLGFYSERYSKVYLRQEFLIFQLFNQPNFIKKYRQYLKDFAEPYYLDAFFSRHGQEIKTLDSLLNMEYGQDKYDRSFLYSRANDIREFLEDHQFDHPPFQYEIFEKSYSECKARYPLEAVSINANRLTLQNENTLILRNYFCEPIHVVAIGAYKTKPTQVLNRPLFLSAYDIHSPPPKVRLEARKNDQYVFYKTTSNSSWYRKKISKLPSDTTDYSISIDQVAWDSTIFKNIKDTLWLAQGTYQIDDLQVFPIEKTVVLQPGCQINLVGNGGLVIKGSLVMKGTKDNPIYVRSSERSNNGISVMNPGKSTDITWSVFENLQPLQTQGSWHTGGLTFYKTRLNMEDCQILNCQSEDALNIVSSKEISLLRVSFDHCLEDALDVDFSEGIVQECTFVNIGGDAVDLSGSQIEVKNIRASGIGDKAFSIGEKSIVQMTQSRVQKATVGIAVKDGSEVMIDQVLLDQADYAIVVYEKKDYYSGAFLNISNLTLVNNRFDLGIESGQVATRDGRNLEITHPKHYFSRILYANKDE